MSGRRGWAALAAVLIVGGTAGAASGASTAPTSPSPSASSGTTSAPAGQFGKVVPVGTSLKIGFSAVSVDPLDLDTASVRLKAEKAGTSVERKPTATASGGGLTVVLALDTSLSMKEGLTGGGGTRFQAAQAAARNFLGNLPDTVKVGLVTFGYPAKAVVRPTTNHQVVRKKIDSLNPKGDTALFGAVSVASKLVPRQDQGMVVMVTDGDNSLGDRQLTPTEVQQENKQRKQATKIIAGGLFFRGLIIGSETATDLRDIAPGKVLDDGNDVSDSLATLFAQATQVLDRSTVLTVDGLDDAYLQGLVTITVTVRTTGGDDVTTSTSLTLVKPAPATTSNISGALPVVVETGSPIGTPVLLGALGALFVALSVILASVTGVFSGGDAKAAAMAERLSFYTVRGARPVRIGPGREGRDNQSGGRLSDNKLTRGAVAAIDRLARQRQLDHALDARLEAAGLPIRTAEWMLLHVGAAVGFGLLLLIAARGMWLGAVLGLLIGFGGPWLFLSLLTARRASKFLGQLPDTLQLLAGSLAAGYSLPQAMDAVLREAQAPISTEFNRALVETRLGMPPEDALEGIATRTGSRDFSWIVMAIRIQREVGGNLAELLSTVAQTLRERERLRRQVVALSAEGRLSGFILGALPIVFALFLIFFKPDYIAPLLSTLLGWIMLGVGTLLLIVGGIWMSRVVKVEV
ncbi:type II secretion system F family protein [Spongisporangium articulatum]|uniref:Type II secretion system F family protein n=1 Tax=Spongisporangium articulatum TaxID=3362603 RepID=A0ABW8ASW5_9ACTN